MTQDSTLAQATATWAETRQRLQARWPGLTTGELDATQGGREQLIALLESQLGYARANAESDVDRFLSGGHVGSGHLADDGSRPTNSEPLLHASGTAIGAAASRYPWGLAGIAGTVAGVALASMLVANRRARRRHLVIPLPTQAESAQAVEVAGRAAGATWGVLRSLTVLLVGGLAGWGARRYHAR